MGTVARTAVVTDAAAILAPAIELLRDSGVAVTVIDEGTAPPQAAARAAEFPVVIIGVMPFGKDEIETLRDARLIIRAGIGYDMVDIDAATEAGIIVANVPDFCVDEVADHTLALILAAMRRLPQAMETWRRQRDWHVTSQLPALHRLRSKRLGIIGLGRIGLEVAKRANAFGMEVVGYDPMLQAGETHGEVKALSLDDVVRTSDVLSLHCPLTDDTRHIVGTDRLAAMKPGAVLINTSRGGLIDLDALAIAIEGGTVAVAALDVLEGEPTPDLNNPLLSHENVIVTSHMAWYSVEAKRELAINTAKEALRFLGDEAVRNPVNSVTPQAPLRAE